jgi:hypothetical protein
VRDEHVGVYPLDDVLLGEIDWEMAACALAASPDGAVVAAEILVVLSATAAVATIKQPSQALVAKDSAA